MKVISRVASSISIGLIVIAITGMHVNGEDTQTWLTHAPATELKDTIVYQALSDFGGKHYEATLYGRDLEGVVKWKDEAELPISILKAKTIAEAAFVQKFPQFGQFKLTSIEIIHITLIDDWIIRVEFYDPNASAIEDKAIDLLVLLNGRVIAPIVTAK